MLLVKTFVMPSPVHGLGLFAAEAIRAGALVRQWNPAFDREFSEEAAAALPPAAREFLDHFGWTAPGGGLRVSLDGSRYTNHGADPNLVVRGDATYARRDIAAGEELLEDYTAYEPGWRPGAAPED
jgi:uncharacterized protein